VIRGWLGHVNLATTNRYADINIRTKEAALRQCAPPPGVGGPKARAPVWRNDDHARLARLSVTVVAVNRYAATWNQAAA